MTADSSKGFVFSTLLHGSVVALMFVAAYVAKRPDIVPVFEIVAGEGDNFGAKVAPALGSETGLKMNVPNPPAPIPEPPKPAPVKVEPAPVVPAPPPKVEPKITPKPAVTEPPPPNFAKDIKRTLTTATNKAKKEIKKKEEADAKRAAEEAKKLTKEEFDRQNKSKAPTQVAKNTTSSKAPKVDVEGIKKGVLGGSTENKIGGAGGKVLKTDNENVLGAYFAMFKEKLREKFEAPPGLSDTLKVEVEIVSHADGSISGAQIAKSSGSKEFDDAVLAAVRRVRMPARPDKKTESGVRFTFTMRERDER
jgi:colicin import membrane protein